jgi:hypothetical protein
MAKITINNGDSGLVVRNALNNMFTELYSAITSPLKLNNISVNTEQVILANSYIGDIYITKKTGTPTIRIGTTPNGQDVVPEVSPGTLSQVTYQDYVSADTTLYITITGGAVDIRIGVLYNFF